MGRRSNELFIGSQHLNSEGRTLKHPALINIYANINVNKIKDEPISLIGMDLETNADTAELKLLGFWNGYKYGYYTSNFLNVLFSWIRLGYNKKRSLAYWNRLDPFVLYKQFLLEVSPEEQQTSMERFGKIAGEWDRKHSKWTIDPVIEVKMGDWYVGIKNVVRSSVQFFYYRLGDEKLKVVWAYDIAQLYPNGLEKEATSRYDYYSKVDKSAHLVDWNRFDNDEDYRENIVLKSNELDSRAVYDLGMNIQVEAFKAFGYYPSTLVSQASFARSAIIANLTNKYKAKYPDNEELVHENVLNDVKSIGFINHYDDWTTRFGGDVVKDLYCLSTECYSGARIEAYKYGYAKDGYTADITQAYPDTIKDLYDLRDSIITTGTGTPPNIKNSYCFIRGEVDVPDEVIFHPITVKHPMDNNVNICATGKYRASYTSEERNFCIGLGVKFTNETWYNIETKGILSPLAEVANDFIALRASFRAEGNTAEFMAKTAVASMYGILFEAVDTFEKTPDGVKRAGYRAGEFWNPFFATIITSRTRILISKASHIIEEAGGKVILAMTDSLLWTGTAEMLPDDLWREVKTVGYFEKPSHVKNIICLGSGRYGYETDKGYLMAKKRGLNAVELHDPKGVVLNDFNWFNALDTMAKTKSEKIELKVRMLISVGLVVNSNEYTILDLGRVLEVDREVDVIVGKNKRLFNEDLKNASLLAKTLIDTRPFYLGYGMGGYDDLNDQTLPFLRNELMKKVVVTRKQKDQVVKRRASKKYYDSKKEKIRKEYSEKYEQLRELGYTQPEAKKMASWSMDRILNKMKEDKK